MVRCAVRVFHPDAQQDQDCNHPTTKQCIDCATAICDRHQHLTRLSFATHDVIVSQCDPCWDITKEGSDG